jgi:hypothetical protein
MLNGWPDVFAAYLTSLQALVGGVISGPSLLAGIGTICLVIGVALCLAQRERRALWMLVPLALASLTPFVLAWSSGMLGWLSVLFAAAAGIALLVIITGVVARDTRHRTPIWLLGLFTLTLAAHAGYAPVSQILMA